MELFAEPADVAAIWRELDEAETAAAVGLIAAASVKLMARVPGVAGLVDADPLRGEIAKYAVAAAVKRVLINPEGARQFSETTGPFSESVTVDSAISSGALYLDDADLVGLVPAVSSWGPVIGSARLRMGLA